ncbi:MAG: metal-dependent hydrolase [Gemmatimonadota bacterium]
MDNVTHALAGALLAAVTCRVVEQRAGEPSATFRRAAYTLGVLTAELPDADLLYAGAPMHMGKLGYLLHHRGYTHTVLFAIASAVLVWAVALAFRRGLRVPEYGRPLLLLALVGTLSHLALDYSNSYGVHPFWPVDRRWFYGDAVFIVEPWFWVVALPALLFIARRTFWRVVSGLLLLGIVVASWRISLVGTSVAAVLTMAAIAWTVFMRAVPPSARAVLALAGWMVLEAVFFSGSVVARRAVRREVGLAYRDLALSPAPGNPFCLSGVLVRVDGDRYGTSRATIAPWPALHDAFACHERSGARTAADSASGSGAIRWEGSWSAPLSELRHLALGNCSAAAALWFIRVPVWRREGDGTGTLSDLRFGEGAGSFASVTIDSGGACPHPVPDWEFPRRDLLGPAP